MSRASRFLAPLLAIGVFAFVLVQTLGALQDSGVWSFSEGRRAMPAPPDPLLALDGTLARQQAAAFAGSARDPFAFGAAPTRPVETRPAVRRPVVPPPPAVPVLTAIVYDADPRAILRWQGREYPVHAGALFDEFVVVSITRDQVVLRRGTEEIVLRRQPQGD